MNADLQVSAERAAEIVSAYFRPPVSAIEARSPAVAARLGGALDPTPAARRLSSPQLDALIEPIAAELLDLDRVPVYGAGFIAAFDLLDDTRSHLSWWQGVERRKLVLAAGSINKEGMDYSGLEWFRVPFTTGLPHLAGPYVDYLCSEEYMITIVAPVRVGDGFVGVAGLDLLVDDVERQLLPQLRELGSDVTLVNSVGRVVVSTDSRFAAGDTIRGRTFDEQVRLPCPEMQLEVLVTPAATARAA